MQNEDFENSYAYRACQSILAGDQKSALEYAKKAFPSLVDDPETVVCQQSLLITVSMSSFSITTMRRSCIPMTWFPFILIFYL